jgi:hypothetical protein
MKKTLLSLSIALAGTAIATPFTGNDAQSNALGNTGVASATPQNAFQFNPGLLADYPENVDFGLTLPSVKFFVDDSLGFIEAGEDFFTGGTLDDFQNIDVDAINTAINGDGAAEASLTDVFSDLLGNITKLTEEVTDIQADIADDFEINNSVNNNNAGETNLFALNDASSGLTANTDILDTKIEVTETQSENLAVAVQGTTDGIESLNNKPLQIGLGIDILNVAIPSERLAMAMSISTTSTAGVSFNLSSEDASLLTSVTTDLVAITGEAGDVTTELSGLATANQTLTDHLGNQPDPADYAGGAVNAQYQTDIQSWSNDLATYSDAVDSAQQDVNTELDDVTSFTGEVLSTSGSSEIDIPEVDELESNMDIVGANISEVGVSLARRFVISGEDVAIGVTPKVQSINIFEKNIALASYDEDLEQLSSDPGGLLQENSTSLFRVNVDIGAAKTWDFYGRARAGIALKDIIPWTLESSSGTELLIRPKLRVGAAHETDFTKVAIDLDITENKPLKYGVPTRYLGLGAEFSLWNHAAIRAGYRNNLSVADSSVISGGIGLTPFGTGLDISAWVKPKFDDPTALIQDVGAVVQFSVNF